VYGAESHQTLRTVKGLGNTFDLNHKWARILPLGILHEIFIEPLLYRCCHLILYCELELLNPTQAVKSFEGMGNTFELNPTWERTVPLVILHGIFVETFSQYGS